MSLNGLFFVCLLLNRVAFHESTECPSGYSYEASVPGCYKVVSGNVHRSTAAAACASFNNGWLVTVNDVAENSYISTLGTIWLGATKAGSTVVWDHGSSSYYGDWYPGEPGGGVNEPCIVSYNHLNYGFRWHDFPCQDYRLTGYVCENDLIEDEDEVEVEVSSSKECDDHTLTIVLLVVGGFVFGIITFLVGYICGRKSADRVFPGHIYSTAPPKVCSTDSQVHVANIECYRSE